MIDEKNELEHIPRILIVDDEVTNQLILKNGLSKLNCNIDIAENGMDALALCEENTYALILLDLMMPFFNGFETLIRIKVKSRNVNTPVFMITGVDATPSILLKAYKAGALDFINKPININILRRKAKFFIEFYQSRQKLKREKLLTDNLMKSRMNLMANITHEIRTPLFAMVGMIDILESMGLTEEQQNIVNKVQLNSDILLNTVNSFLDYSKLEMSEAVYQPTNFDLVQNCAEIVDIMSYQHKKSKHVNLSMEFDSRISNIVNTDKDKIRHVLINLISNALKFTEQGVVKLIVKLVDDNHIMFIVQDSGIGIPKEQIDSLFEEYSQVDNEMQNRVQGTGLGLSISCKLVSVLGGDLKVDSQMDFGSKFYFTIPLGVISEQVIDESKLENNKEVVLETGHTESKLSILIIDDVYDNIFVFENYLNELDLELETTTDSETAAEKMVSSKYDIIFLDINMPNKNGFEVANEYATLCKERNIKPAILTALTAYNIDGDSREHFESAGFNDYLMKPIRRKDLISFLNKKQSELVQIKLKEDSVQVQKGEADGEILSDQPVDDGKPIEDFSKLDKAFVEYLPRYVKNKSDEVSEMRQNVEDKDLEGVAGLCHKILGTALSFGLIKLNDIIEEIHVMTRKDFTGNYDKILKLSREIEDYIKDLDTRVKEGKVEIVAR